jgi:hypothetical protein
MRKWTKKHEAELREGIARGLKPAISDEGNYFLCNRDGCNHVAWDCFAVDRMELNEIQNDPEALHGTLMREVYCSVEHQSARLMEIDSYLFPQES